MAQNNEEGAASSEAASVSDLEESFNLMQIKNDPELVMHYKMLFFVHNKDYLKRVHLISVWKEFLLANPEYMYSAMELKVEFYLRILRNVDKYDRLSPAQNAYFKSRVINKNADELLQQCDLERGVHFMRMNDGPSILPFNAGLPKVTKRNFFGKEVKTQPLSVGSVGAAKSEFKDWSLWDLLVPVFQTPSERTTNEELSKEEITKRINQGIRDKIDWDEYLDKFFRTMEGQDKSQESQQPLKVDNGSDLSGAILKATSSTPVSSRVPRAVTRSSSDQDHRRRRRDANPARASSADRSIESFKRFEDRMKTRSRKRLPRN